MKKLFFVALLSSLAIGSARADNPDLMTLIGASSAGSNYAVIDNSGTDLNGNASTYNLSSSDHNSFAVDYGNSGVVRGHGRCSTRSGSDYETVDNLTDETGNGGARYCYCRLDSYTASGGSAQFLSGPWVFNYGDGGANGCADGCADSCAYDLLADGSAYLAFRAAMFNAYAPGTSGGASGTSSVVTTQTYVDNLLSGKQAKITTTGTNKLMTYGASTGATPGSRDIVSTLGTSTTATTVPETGPIVTAVNNKQNIVNGTANYIMTGTGTAGTVGEKPVYSTTTNYTNALVTAQTINTAAATAANSELSCIDNDCLLWQINTSGPAGISTRIYFNPDASINGTSYCYINQYSGTRVTGNCSNTTMSALDSVGQSGNPWGVVFPYGEISGVGVCSNATVPSGSVGTVATEAQATALDDKYNYIVSNNINRSDNKSRCWCKMTSPATSNWVFAYYFSSVSCDSSSCGGYCGRYLQNVENMRIGVFGSIN